jgi:hypothetical protein
VRGSLLSSLGALAIAAAVALGVAGCGGGSDSSSSSSESTGATTAAAGGGKQTKTAVHSSSLSKEEFVEKADAICVREKTKGLEAMGAYAKEHQGAAGQSKAEVIGEAIQKVFLPSVQAQVDQIRALGAPEGEEQEVEAVLVALEEAVEEASHGTPSSARFSQSFANAGALATEYGLTSCVYG